MMIELDKEIEEKWIQATEAFTKGDKKLSLNIFKEIADMGYEYAYVEIANIYELGGQGLDKDIEKAKQWYKKSANDLRDEEACLALARIFYLGLDGEVNYKKAFQYYSDEILSDNSIAQLRLGIMYQLGEGFDNDFKKAEHFYLKSAKNKNLVALGCLADLYFEEKRIIKGSIFRLVAFISSFLVLSSFNKRLSLRKW